MKRRFVLVVVAMIVALVGCEGAHREHGDDDPGPDGGMDVVTCGSVTCDQIPAASCVDADTLREHTAACTDATCSYPATDTECGAAGCCGDHCCAVTPSNADETGTLMPTGLVIAPPNGTFNTDTDCQPISALGKCTLVARIGLPEACVCRSDELTIDTLEVKGTRALVLLVLETVRIQTTLDVSGDFGEPGPGAMPEAYTPSGGQVGAVGGSFATLGGSAHGNDTAIMATYGDATLVPLRGGTSGQRANYMTSTRGGGGGGAVQISAGKRIEVVGSIFAGGGGGPGGISHQSYSGASGGGSGGAILLEAPSLMVTGTLNANGAGGGGGGGETRSGENGQDANTGVALGGEGDDGGGCSLQGHTTGGHGGAGATSSSLAGMGEHLHYISGCFNPAYVGGGGGGGGLGRIRINTTSGCQCSGTVSPTPSFGMVGVN